MTSRCIWHNWEERRWCKNRRHGAHKIALRKSLSFKRLFGTDRIYDIDIVIAMHTRKFLKIEKIDKKKLQNQWPKNWKYRWLIYPKLTCGTIRESVRMSGWSQRRPHEHWAATVARPTRRKWCVQSGIDLLIASIYYKCNWSEPDRIYGFRLPAAKNRLQHQYIGKRLGSAPRLLNEFWAFENLNWLFKANFREVEIVIRVVDKSAHKTNRSACKQRVYQKSSRNRYCLDSLLSSMGRSPSGLSKSTSEFDVSGSWKRNNLRSERRCAVVRAMR